MITWATTSYRVNKLVTEMRMILLRHFYLNICGVCELCGEEVEDLPHILLPKCPRLAKQADKLLVFAKAESFWSKQAKYSMKLCSNIVGPVSFS